MSTNGYAAEMTGAQATLQRAVAVAQLFCRKLGAVAPMLLPPFGGPFGRRPEMVESVLDHKYWFAKLYQLMTYYEIGGHEKFTHPGFVMHFIPIFYNLYYDAMQNYLAGNHADVSTLWMRHFKGPVGGVSAATGLDAVKFSTVTGVTAHLQGDMANALASAYRSWSASPKPAFAALNDDFFTRNKPLFEVGKSQFFLDVGQKGPFPLSPEAAQSLIGMGEQVVGGGLDIDEVHKWRTTAWNAAQAKLSAAPAAPAEPAAKP